MIERRCCWSASRHRRTPTARPQCRVLRRSPAGNPVLDQNPLGADHGRYQNQRAQAARQHRRAEDDPSQHRPGMADRRRDEHQRERQDQEHARQDESEPACGRLPRRGRAYRLCDQLLFAHPDSRRRRSQASGRLVAHLDGRAPLLCALRIPLNDADEESFLADCLPPCQQPKRSSKGRSRSTVTVLRALDGVGWLVAWLLCSDASSLGISDIVGYIIFARRETIFRPHKDSCMGPER